MKLHIINIIFVFCPFDSCSLFIHFFAVFPTGKLKFLIEEQQVCFIPTILHHVCLSYSITLQCIQFIRLADSELSIRWRLFYMLNILRYSYSDDYAWNMPQYKR